MKCHECQTVQGSDRRSEISGSSHFSYRGFMLIFQKLFSCFLSTSLRGWCVYCPRFLDLFHTYIDWTIKSSNTTRTKPINMSQVAEASLVEPINELVDEKRVALLQSASWNEADANEIGNESHERVTAFLAAAKWDVLMSSLRSGISFQFRRKRFSIDRFYYTPYDQAHCTWGRDQLSREAETSHAEKQSLITARRLMMLVFLR